MWFDCNLIGSKHILANAFFGVFVCINEKRSFLFKIYLLIISACLIRTLSRCSTKCAEFDKRRFDMKCAYVLMLNIHIRTIALIHLFIVLLRWFSLNSVTFVCTIYTWFKSYVCVCKQLNATNWTSWLPLTCVLDVMHSYNVNYLIIDAN